MSTGTVLVKPFVVRRNVNQKILAFSILIGMTATVLAAVVYIALFYPSLQRSRQVHQHAFDAIKCIGVTCNTTVFTTNMKLESSDYIIDTKTRFFIDVPNPTEENPSSFAPLDYSDAAFISRFQQPSWYETPDGETWRLYSKKANVENRRLDIIVGFAAKAPWKIVDTDQPRTELVDAALKDEAEKLATSLPVARAPRGGSVDGYEIVDSSTQRVVDWGLWVPCFLPQSIQFPSSGARLYADNGDLFVLQTDTDGRLLASSLIPVGPLFWIVVIGMATFVTSSAIARWLSRRFLRGYFALMTVKVPSLEEALHTGEGSRIEFKRGLSDDPARMRNAEEELLRSVAAFANTNDGAIFIGVNDAGQVTGLDLDFKQKDRLEQKIRQLVRTRIKPTPLIQVAFESVQGLSVAKITVARGEATAYMIGGVIYIRDGSSDVQAQPEDLRRLVTEYAY